MTYRPLGLKKKKEILCEEKRMNFEIYVEENSPSDGQEASVAFGSVVAWSLVYISAKKHEILPRNDIPISIGLESNKKLTKDISSSG